METSWFDHAECGGCELLPQRELKKSVFGVVGSKYSAGGMMLIGEGPGTHEVTRGMPFVGESGRLLNALLEAAEIDRDELWVTNATLCQPPPRTSNKKGGLDKRHPTAIPSCMGRLETEIAMAKPRVIVTLGQAPLVSLAGYFIEKQKQVGFDCHGCNNARNWGPGFECALGDCDWYILLPDGVEYKTDAAKEWRKQLIEEHDGACPKCESSIKKLQVKKAIKCRECGGRKTRIETFEEFSHPGHSLMGRDGVAGAVFHADTLPSQLQACGVRFIVPTYHPAFCLYTMKDRSGGAKKQIGGQYAARVLSVHLNKARELLSRDANFVANWRKVSDPDELRRWLADPGTYSIDVEADRKGSVWTVERLTCVGYARADREEAVVVPTYHIEPWWTLGNNSSANRLLDVMQRHAERTDVTKVMHNSVYDQIAMRRLYGIWFEPPVRDTLLEHNNLYPDEEHGLGFIAHELTDMGAWKDTRKLKKDESHEFSGYSSFDELAQYNAYDTRATAIIDETMVGPDGEHGLVATDGRPEALAIDERMLEIAIDMQWSGLPINRGVLTEMEMDAQARMDDELAAMRDIIGVADFEPRGNALLWALYDPTGPLGLPVPARTETGKPSANKDALFKLNDIPFVSHLLAWRKHDYAISHYIRSDSLQVAYDGRIHPTWKPWGARTGRWSSEPNFQNWPKYMRQGVVAPAGRIFVGADFSQLEMRIMAALSGDPELIRRCATADESRKLEPDYDPHSYVASLVFGEAFTNLPLDYPDHQKKGRCKCGTCQRKQLREIVKRVVYGLNYGAGAQTVLEAIYAGGYDGPPLTIDLIERVTKIYFRAFPGVPVWRENVLRQAQADQAIYSPIYGRHRIFPLGHIEATVAYNFPIQSGASDIVNMRLDVLDREYRHVDNTAMLIAQVHDAVYVECAEAKAQEMARLVEDTLSIEMSIVDGAPSMPFTASAAIARNWMEAA